MHMISLKLLNPCRFGEEQALSAFLETTLAARLKIG
jgi:hypothetical protein